MPGWILRESRYFEQRSFALPALMGPAYCQVHPYSRPSLLHILIAFYRARASSRCYVLVASKPSCVMSQLGPNNQDLVRPVKNILGRVIRIVKATEISAQAGDVAACRRQAVALSCVAAELHLELDQLPEVPFTGPTGVIRPVPSYTGNRTYLVCVNLAF